MRLALLARSRNSINTCLSRALNYAKSITSTNLSIMQQDCLSLLEALNWLYKLLVKLPFANGHVIFSDSSNYEVQNKIKAYS